MYRVGGVKPGTRIYGIRGRVKVNDFARISSSKVEIADARSNSSDQTWQTGLLDLKVLTEI